MEVPNRKIERVFIVVISLAFLIWSTAFIYRSSFIAIDGKRYFCLFDDAMISMRYAWNFSHGFGLVWNQGEYVQGYTNLLMTLVMSFFSLIFDKSTAILCIQVFGAIVMLLIAFVTVKISDYIGKKYSDKYRGLFRVIIFFCVLFYYPLAYWSLMGMETGLLTLLSLLGILSAIKFIINKNVGLLFLASGYLGLAFLTRNDSILFSGLIFAYIIWSIFFSTSKGKLTILLFITLAIIIYLLFVAGQLGFQYLYYGEVVPNTYTLKLTGMPLSLRAISGVGFILRFLIESAVIIVLSFASLVIDFHKEKVLLFLCFITIFIYQIFTGGDPWNYWRIISPSMPLLIILFINATRIIAINFLDILNSRTFFLRSPKLKMNMILVLISLLIIIGMLSANGRFFAEIILFLVPYQTEYNQANVNSAIAINQLTTDNSTIGVFWAGSIPYYSGRKAIDFLGKSDRYIAQLPPDISGSVSWGGMTSVPGHNKYDLNYSIKTMKPTFIQGFQWGSQNLSEWVDNNYVKVEYNGVNLILLRNSSDILWEKINAP